MKLMPIAMRPLREPPFPSERAGEITALTGGEMPGEIDPGIP